MALRLLSLVLLAAVAVTLYLVPRDAHARRGGIILITTGDTITDIGPIAEEHREAVEETTGPGARVVYGYSYGGVFWLDLWTYDGAFYVQDQRDELWSLTDEEAAELLGGSASPPLGYRFPPLLVLLGLSALVYAARAVIMQRRMHRAMADV